MFDKASFKDTCFMRLVTDSNSYRYKEKRQKFIIIYGFWLIMFGTVEIK
jgi:hypothetical protein